RAAPPSGPRWMRNGTPSAKASAASSKDGSSTSASWPRFRTGSPFPLRGYFVGGGGRRQVRTPTVRRVRSGEWRDTHEPPTVPKHRRLGPRQHYDRVRQLVGVGSCVG